MAIQDNYLSDGGDYRKALALAMLRQGIDTSPVKHWTQGAARVAQALIGGMVGNQLQGEQVAAMQWNPTAAPGGSADASPMGNKVADALAGGDASQPRGIRNNNPLNIEAGSFTQSQPGFAGSDGRFAKFQSPDQGVAAADALLQTYAQKHGLNTVGGIVNRWAPPSDNNPTSSYAATVAKQIGVDPNAPLNMQDPSTRQKLIAAMGQFENGRPIQMAQADQAGIPPNAQPTAQAGQPSMQVAQAQPTTDMLNQMERNVDRTLNDPNAPLAVKQKAYGYKQFIIQKRMEQSLKYGPEALAGAQAIAGAQERGKLAPDLQAARTSEAGATEAAKERAKHSSDLIAARALEAGEKTRAEKQASLDVQAGMTKKNSGINAGFVGGLVNEAINQIDKHPYTAAGPMGQFTKGIESSPAGVLDSTLKGIQARIGFEELNKMRAASPTGGALGQVSEMENKLLASVYGGITPGLPKDVLKTRLRKLERVYNAVINEGPEAAAKAFYAEERPGQSAAPSGIDPKLWSHMTPEERSLWKK